MEFEIGDLVTRNSYNNDTVFEITDIINDVCYLKGINIRLKADSEIEDLKKFDVEDIEEREFEEKVKFVSDLNREDYFYIPGKILHIEADYTYVNKYLTTY